LRPELSPDYIYNKKKSFILNNYNTPLRRNSSKKTFSQKNKSNIEFNDFSTFIEPIKRNDCLKIQYDHNSEIINLPGPIKRENKDIKDDIFTLYNKRKGTAYGIKNQQLYQSRVNCLNGNGNDFKIPNMKKSHLNINTDSLNNNFNNINHEKNLTFITNFSQKDMNNISGNYKKQFNKSRNEIFNILHQEPLKTKYKYSYKNMSQFTLS
jgi:hypothetical protein